MECRAVQKAARCLSLLRTHSATLASHGSSQANLFAVSGGDFSQCEYGADETAPTVIATAGFCGVAFSQGVF